MSAVLLASLALVFVADDLLYARVALAALHLCCLRGTSTPPMFCTNMWAAGTAAFPAPSLPAVRCLQVHPDLPAAVGGHDGGGVCGGGGHDPAGRGRCAALCGERQDHWWVVRKAGPLTAWGWWEVCDVCVVGQGTVAGMHACFTAMVGEVGNPGCVQILAASAERGLLQQ